MPPPVPVAAGGGAGCAASLSSPPPHGGPGGEHEHGKDEKGREAAHRGLLRSVMSCTTSGRTDRIPLRQAARFARASTRRAASVPSRIASSSERGRAAVARLLDARGRARDELRPEPRPRARGRARARAGRPEATVSSSRAKTLRKRASPPAAPDELEVVLDADARAVEALRGRGCAGTGGSLSPTVTEATASVTSLPAAREHLGGVEPGRVAAPVGDDDPPPLGHGARPARPRPATTATSSSGERRARRDARPSRRRRRPARARRRSSGVGLGRRGGRRRRRRSSRSSSSAAPRAISAWPGAAPASAIWPPIRPPARARRPRARRAPASAAAASPAGPGADDDEPPRARDAGSGRGKRPLRARSAGSSRTRSACPRGSGRCRRCSRCSGRSSCRPPARAFAGRSGSVISARVIPTASATPSAIEPVGLGRIDDPRRRDQRHARAGTARRAPRSRSRRPAAAARSRPSRGRSTTRRARAQVVDVLVDERRSRSRRAASESAESRTPSASPGAAARTARTTSSRKRLPSRHSSVAAVQLRA